MRFSVQAERERQAALEEAQRQEEEAEKARFGRSVVSQTFDRPGFQEPKFFACSGFFPLEFLFNFIYFYSVVDMFKNDPTNQSLDYESHWWNSTFCLIATIQSM